jgi:periplasmic protein TonB
VSPRATLRAAVPVVLGLVVLALLALGVHRLIKDSAAPKKRAVQQISLVKPPLPPKPEKPPEPEKKEQVKQEIRTPEPEKDDSPPPPSEQLGVDAKGVAGNDAFGLAGRPGGRDITTIGPGVGTGSGRGNAFYASQLQSELQEALNGNEGLRAAEYRAQVSLWLSPEGNVTRVEIAGSTGNAEIDKRLRATLREAKRLKPPPEGLAQPIRLELAARRT